MATVGDTIVKFGRQYIFVNPNSFTGPGNWCISNPDAIVQPSNNGIQSVTGDIPIEVDILNATANVSLDITELTEETN